MSGVLAILDTDNEGMYNRSDHVRQETDNESMYNRSWKAGKALNL